MKVFQYRSDEFFNHNSRLAKLIKPNLRVPTHPPASMAMSSPPPLSSKSKSSARIIAPKMNSKARLGMTASAAQPKSKATKVARVNKLSKTWKPNQIANRQEHPNNPTTQSHPHHPHRLYHPLGQHREREMAGARVELHSQGSFSKVWESPRRLKLCKRRKILLLYRSSIASCVDGRLGVEMR